MDKNIKEYNKYIQNEINKLSQEIKLIKNKDIIISKIKNLSDFHYKNVCNFQHERFIHLIITLFFAGLFIVFAILPLILSATFSTGNEFYFTLYATLIIDLIILILKIFYIKYYFELENGTQRLYKYSKTIYQIIEEYN